MDLQETFDKVTFHLITQNKRAVHADLLDTLPKLLYVTPDGLKDAIGCLLPDGTYNADMEGYAFKGMDTWKQYDSNGGLAKLRVALKNGRVFTDDEMVMRLLTDLQHVHDNNEPELWPPRLKAIARTWRLSDFMVEHGVMVRDAALKREVSHPRGSP